LIGKVGNDVAFANEIIAIALAKPKNIVASAAGENIVASATDQCVVSAATPQHIIAAHAGEAIIACRATQCIVLRCAHAEIVSGTKVQRKDCPLVDGIDNVITGTRRDGGIA
jgi:hypothetical protein